MLGVWSEVEALRHSHHYDALLGSPTWRERLVATGRRLLTHREETGRSPWRLAVPALATGALAASVAVAVLFLNPASQRRYAAQDQARSVTLPDRSSVILAPGSTLAFEMAGGLRIARLEGEAELRVAPDASHPFLVNVGKARVRVVGTHFTLAHRGACTQLSVQEGSVEIASPTTRPRRLGAGEEAAVVDSANSRDFCLKSGEGPSLRWSYIDAPLGNVLADVAPFYPRGVVIRSPDIARERVTISFEGAQIGEMVDLLPEVLDVRLERGADGTVYISR